LGDTHTESRDDQYRQQNSFHVWFHRSVELTVGSGHTRSTAFGYTEPVAVASQLSANRSFSGAEVDCWRRRGWDLLLEAASTHSACLKL
jgi:hypothetical protein